MAFIQWPPPAPWAIVAAAAIVAVIAVAAVIRRSLRRRQLHRLLIQESVQQLCAYQGQEPTGIRRTHRELVRLVIGQVAQAGALDELVRPHLSGRLEKRSTNSAVPVAEAGVVAIRNALLTLARTEPVLPDSNLEAIAVRPHRGPLRPPPKLDDVAPMSKVFAAMRDTLRAQVRQVQIVVKHADLLGLIKPECRDRLLAELTEVLAADHAGERLAAAGQHAAAAGVLAEVRVPIPPDSLPGEGANHQLGQQALALTDIALAYRDALTEWCLDALARCGVAAPQTDQVAT